MNEHYESYVCRFADYQPCTIVTSFKTTAPVQSQHTKIQSQCCGSHTRHASGMRLLDFQVPIQRQQPVATDFVHATKSRFSYSSLLGTKGVFSPSASRYWSLRLFLTTLTHKDRSPLVRKGQNRSCVVVNGLIPLTQSTQHIKGRSPDAGQRTLIFSPSMVVAIEAEDRDEPGQ